MSKKWCLILMEAETWEEVSAVAYDVAIQVGIEDERPHSMISSNGFAWTGEGNRPSADDIGKLIKR